MDDRKLPLPVPEAARFYEEQYFRQWWMNLLLFGGLVAVIFGPLIELYIGPENPTETWTILITFTIFMLLLIFFFRRIRLRVWVMEDVIHVRYWPLVFHRVIPLAEVKKFEAVTYRPIVEYGGWGLRGLPGNLVYNVSGNRGVQFEFIDDKKLLIGSQRADEFADAVRSVYDRA
ncbi:hypothetical protein KQI52_13945 [bacterium]|nr:hypothetical protein [bacterium]